MSRYRVKTPLRLAEGVCPAGSTVDLPDQEASAYLREDKPPIEPAEPAPTPASQAPPKPKRAPRKPRTRTTQ